MGKMRTHFIPRYYLNGFADNKGRIWTYRKGHSAYFRSTPNNAAVECDFYSETDEKLLANKIEYPALSSVQKIRNRETITLDEKKRLAIYALNFILRVPHGKVRVKSLISEILPKVFSDEALRHFNGGREPSAKLKEQANKLRRQWESEPETVEWLWSSQLSTEKRIKLVAALEEMIWQFLTHYEEPAFVTSDSPFFLFPHLGIGNELSEVTFPLSQNVALWATRRKELSEGFFPVSKDIVSEINRRTVCQATRDVFFPADDKRVVNLVNQNTYDLHRIIVVANQHILHPFEANR
jgi:hypothetical protein